MWHWNLQLWAKEQLEWGNLRNDFINEGSFSKGLSFFFPWLTHPGLFSWQCIDYKKQGRETKGDMGIYYAWLNLGATFAGEKKLKPPTRWPSNQISSIFFRVSLDVIITRTVLMLVLWPVPPTGLQFIVWCGAAVDLLILLTMRSDCDLLGEHSIIHGLVFHLSMFFFYLSTCFHEMHFLFSLIIRYSYVRVVPPLLQRYSLVDIYYSIYIYI